MKKFIAVLLVLCIVLAMAVGCGQKADNQSTQQQSEQSSQQAQQSSQQPQQKSMKEIVQQAKDLASKVTSGGFGEIKGEPTIGVVMPTLDNEGWMAYYIGIVMGAIESGAGLITYTANNDVQKQMSTIEDLIVKKVDGILFAPVDSTALTAAVQKANQAGIPVGLFDRSTTGGDVSVLVESDNLEHGREAARQLAKLANGKEIKVFNLQGDLATSAGLERNKGFVEELQNYPNIKIVAEISGGWQPEKGNAATMDAFQAHPDINAIYVASEGAYIQGVVSALQQLNKLKKVGEEGHIIIVGIDGQPIGLKMIRDGYEDVSVAQQILTIGDTAIKNLVKVIKCEKLDEKVIRMAPSVITITNVDDENHWANQFKD